MIYVKPMASVFSLPCLLLNSISLSMSSDRSYMLPSMIYDVSDAKLSMPLIAAALALIASPSRVIFSVSITATGILSLPMKSFNMLARALICLKDVVLSRCILLGFPVVVPDEVTTFTISCFVVTRSNFLNMLTGRGGISESFFMSAGLNL